MSGEGKDRRAKGYLNEAVVSGKVCHVVLTVSQNVTQISVF